MSFAHAIIWLDHRDAKITRLTVDAQRTVQLHSNSSERKIHHRTNTIGSGHAADDHHFFDEIAAAVRGVTEIVVCGPGNAKTAFMTYLADRHPEVSRAVVGVETVDHPTEGELLAWARRYFKGVDQLGVSSTSER